MQPIHTKPPIIRKCKKPNKTNHPHASNGHVDVKLSLRFTLNGTLIKRILKLSLGEKEKEAAAYRYACIFEYN